ncbi:hypothetical protein AAFF_G00385040 [Aldrovandia affinis]|uniref:TNFR-Cys domain-containing protein n=1 Tax=Aldrovandia affinis TaxID=143900 RepID=A0AAD7SF26_9TELE|nr:hypothetical protein AAFF_G00385040 [Aldrovandia affinis]
MCRPGESRRLRREGCAPCLENQYQPIENNDKNCINCQTCDENSGSKEILKCSPTMNTQCKCRDGFVPNKKDPGSCKCAKGSELFKTEKKCVKCQEGYFNADAGMECKKWTDCGLMGVKIHGSSELDVVCNDNLGDSQISITPKLALSAVRVKQTTSSTSATVPTTFPPTSTSALGPSSTLQPYNDRSSGHVFALVPVLLLLLLLMSLSPLFCKKIVQNCKKKFTKADTPCHKPVEESGHSCHSSLVKSCQGQP